MYIQPQEEPVVLPKGYSGSAFSGFGALAKPSPERTSPSEREEQPLAVEEPRTREAQFEEDDSAPVSANLHEADRENSPPPKEREESKEAFCHHGGGTRGKDGLGFFSKLPFLSSFLPPSGKKSSFLPDWAIPLILLYLLLERPENDLLPFLLILLLWD